MIALALVPILLSQAASPGKEPAEWGFLLSGDMTSVLEPGEPEAPLREIEANFDNLRIAQITVTELEARFTFSVSNCANGIKRIETSVDVPIDLSLSDQMERFRDAVPSVVSVQAACDLKPIDPLSGNFMPVFAELIGRDQAYRAARAEWHQRRLRPKSKKSAL